MQLFPFEGSTALCGRTAQAVVDGRTQAFLWEDLREDHVCVAGVQAAERRKEVARGFRDIAVR